MQHFLDISGVEGSTLKSIISDAMAMKSGTMAHDTVLAGKTIAMIFEKPSTRTRVSFEVGISLL